MTLSLDLTSIIIGYFLGIICVFAAGFLFSDNKEEEEE